MSIKISLNFVPNGPIYNIPALVQIMAWRRPSDKPLSEPMMVSLLAHICVTPPQWVKTYGYTICLALWYKSNTRMLVTFGICFKQHFDTRYLVFYNPSPPRMFLSLDLLWEYRIQHDANGPFYVTSSYSTWIFFRGVSGFATDCPCGVWCRGLTTFLLHVGPPFGNRIFKKQLGCRFDIMDKKSYFFVFWHAIIYVLIHQIIFRFYLFSSTFVLTSSIDVVFILSIGNILVQLYNSFMAWVQYGCQNTHLIWWRATQLQW